jgi:predicted nucleic acid-binding protein
LQLDDSLPVLTSLVMVDFYSLLRKLAAQSRLTHAEVEEIREFLRGSTVIIDSPAELLDRAWEIAVRLGQSDVFDAYGYAA